MATWRTTCALLSLAVLCPPSSAIKILEGGDACDRDLANPDEMCCGLKTFNVKTSFCCGGIPVHIPCIGAGRNCSIRPPGYDIDKQTCLFGETITKEAPCCPGEERHFCCGGEVRDLPIKECVLDNVYKDEVCCREFRIRGDFASCCAERFPYIAEHEMCCGTFVAPREGYSTEFYSYPDSVLEMMDTTKQICIGGNVLRRNSSTEDKIGYCCGTEIVPKVSPTTPPPTTAKPTPVCGSKSYDPSRFICCSGYTYPINVYLCCEGQVQGRPVDAACCGRYAYSRLGHRCVRGAIIVPKVSPTKTRPKAVCGSKSYDPSRFICCSGYPYPINVYLCCEGQVQGKPVYAACCGRYAYSRLGHRCVRGVIRRL